MGDEPLVYLIAGEPSGDALGAGLMQALAARGPVRFAGIGGDAMTAAGLNSLFPMTELTLMGLAEIVPHIPKLLARIRQTADDIERCRPDVLVTIDAPDFCHRVAKRLKGSGIPIVHYVAPSVWAWRPGRARKLAGLVDHLLCLLPFEPPYFEREGLPATFIGHSVVERPVPPVDKAAFRTLHAIGAKDPLLCVLPGSRMGEGRRLMPVFADTAVRIARDRPDLKICIPTVPRVARTVRRAAMAWPVPVTVLEGDRDRWGGFAAADAALAASGTVSLELGLAGTPHAVAYRVNRMSAFIARRLVGVDSVNLINLVSGRRLIPEFIQENCRADLLAPAMSDLLTDRAGQADAAVSAVMTRLGLGGRAPSDRAADVVCRVMRRG